MRAKAGDHIHHAPERVGSVERGERTLHDFDPVAPRERHPAQVAVLDERAGDGLSVQENEDACAADPPDEETRPGRRVPDDLHGGEFPEEPVYQDHLGRGDLGGLDALARERDLRAPARGRAHRDHDLVEREGDRARVPAASCGLLPRQDARCVPEGGDLDRAPGTLGGGETEGAPWIGDDGISGRAAARRGAGPPPD